MQTTFANQTADRKLSATSPTQARYQDLPCNKRQSKQTAPKAEHGLPTQKRHLLRAMKKQMEYEQLAEKFQYLKSQNQDLKELKKNLDQVESSKLPEKYFRFNFVKPEP